MIFKVSLQQIQERHFFILSQATSLDLLLITKIKLKLIAVDMRKSTRLKDYKDTVGERTWNATLKYVDAWKKDNVSIYSFLQHNTPRRRCSTHETRTCPIPTPVRCRRQMVRPKTQTRSFSHHKKQPQHPPRRGRSQPPPHFTPMQHPRRVEPTKRRPVLEQTPRTPLPSLPRRRRRNQHRRPPNAQPSPNRQTTRP